MKKFESVVGKPLDDSEPKDIARLLAEAFDKVGELVARGGPTDEERALLEEEMRRAAQLTRVWVNFGRWEPKKFERAKKIAAKFTDEHFRAVQCASAYPGDTNLMYEVTELLEKLRRELK